jgi:hypothetical protein
MNETLPAIYYCESYPIGRSVFAGMCLYFDEVLFVSPATMRRRSVHDVSVSAESRRGTR